MATTRIAGSVATKTNPIIRSPANQTLLTSHHAMGIKQASESNAKSRLSVFIYSLAVNALKIENRTTRGFACSTHDMGVILREVNPLRMVSVSSSKSIYTQMNAKSKYKPTGRVG